MCFRPATMDSDIECPECGEKNSMFDTVCIACGAELPKKLGNGAPGAPGMPSAPGAPGMPSAPGAPGAPGMPSAPGAPGMPSAPGV